MARTSRTGAGGPGGTLVDGLRAAPVAVPLLVAVALMVVGSQRDGGYAVTTWAPGALLLLALLALCRWSLPLRSSEVPRPVVVALSALAGFTAWSYLSIAWADDQGVAWEGANRTLLYLVVFALFALWRQRPETAALVLGAWTLALGVLAIVTAVRLGAAGAARELFLGDRFAHPSSYPNASAALWMMAAWPAVGLAAARRVPWALRGAFAGAAVACCDLALLTQSRGAMIATPIVLVLWFALLPERVRRMMAVLPVALAVGLAGPAMLRVGDRLDASGHPDIAGALDAASRGVLLGVVVAGILVAAGAWVESRRPVSEETGRRVHRALGTAGIAGVVVIVIAALAVAGNPVDRARDAWHSFKGGYAQHSSGPRLISGLGSNRYDFYRVGLGLFGDHPIAGIGADNFEQDYMLHGRSHETPRYPHSIEVRTLAQTGLIGAALLLVVFAAAAVAVARAARDPDPLGRAVVVAAAGVPLYWLVHGSADWLWEFAGLGAPAFAALGLACALAPRRAASAAEAAPRRGRARRLVTVLAEVGLVAAIVVLGAPWLAQRQIDRAAREWPQGPARAYAMLRDASSLDPLSDQPALVEASIALRTGDVARADRAFAAALERNPRGAYALLERGAIASARGDRTTALTLLTRAAQENPRDPVTLAALKTARAGKRVDLASVNDQLQQAAQRFR
jgi:hypothetical protein